VQACHGAGPCLGWQRLFNYSFASIYPLYLQKAERKGRTGAEVDEILYWLTGHDAKSLQEAIDSKVTLEHFFADAPALNPARSAVKGVICGVRVEEIEDETTREIRIMDKLIDELAKGKAMEKILRSPA
jgi:hypothetical protein